MTQVYSSPGVPKTLPAVAATSASPMLMGKTFLTTETNLWPAVLVEQGVAVSPFRYSTPIVLPNKIQP